MGSDLVGKWGYSTDEEHYSGSFDTAEQAMEEAAGYARVVGQFRPVSAPEDFIDSDFILERVACQDDYSHDCADGWPFASKEQRAELTVALQKTLADWLDKHDLRPHWCMIDEDTIRIVDDIDDE